jgi:hypothetical protein
MKKQLIVASILLIGLVGFSYRVAPWRVSAPPLATVSAAANREEAGRPDRGTLTAGMPAPGTLTPDERKFAIDYYVKTRDKLLADVKGLSVAQVNWRVDSTRWSVYQCTEHIALAETMIWQWIQMTEHSPATPEKRSDVKHTTEELMTATTDRSHKFQAPEMLKPGAQFDGEQAALDAFVRRRDSTMDYIRTTQDDLKDHFITHPVFGTMDLYQGLVLLAAHTARHTLQIEEVMASPGFPKQ